MAHGPHAACKWFSCALAVIFMYSSFSSCQSNPGRHGYLNYMSIQQKNVNLRLLRFNYLNKEYVTKLLFNQLCVYRSITTHSNNLR